MEGQARCECPPMYLRTIPGLLKIVEIGMAISDPFKIVDVIFTILTFAISFGCYWSSLGGGWVEFTGISCFITVTIWLILHLINCVPQIFLNFLFELISYCVMTIILLISGIIAAARAQSYSYCRSTIGATSFFAFMSAIVCGVDAVLQFLEYRRGNFQSSTTTTTVTTTSTTQSAVKVEY